MSALLGPAYQNLNCKKLEINDSRSRRSETSHLKLLSLLLDDGGDVLSLYMLKAMDFFNNIKNY